MPTVNANEDEFKGQVITWLDEAISQGSYSFDVASSEASLKVSSTTTNFPDIQIWLNRASGMGFCGWELKTPDTRADDKTFLENAARKAMSMNANYFVTWNMRDAIIWRTPNSTEKIIQEHRLRHIHPYSPLLRSMTSGLFQNRSYLKEGQGKYSMTCPFFTMMGIFI